MKSLADRLPPEIARRLHPEWSKNEADYWASRDQLLGSHRDLWIAYAGGQVIASSANPFDVLDVSLNSSRHPFITRVGREDDPVGRIRKVRFSYDPLYAGPALPVLTVEFRQHPAVSGTLMTGVIPDTGADVTSLPWSDCQRLGLDPAAGSPATMGGVGGIRLPTVIFNIWAHLDGRDYRCRLQADPTGDDRILGRDALNQMDVLFRGPAGEVVINP